MRTTLLITAFTAAFVVAGCTKSANTNVNANGGNRNTNAVANTNTAATPADAKPDSAPVGSLATPTDTYKTAYDCRKRKDIDCLKRVMSQDILDFLKMMGEDDKKSLDVMLREMCERPQAPTNESRNEKITGNTATLEYPDESGVWRTMDFEKVGSEWRMSAPGGPDSPEGSKKKP